jgi:hypothetical protein
MFLSADFNQIAERYKNPAKAIKSYDHRFSRWFFFGIFPKIKPGI